MTEENKNNGMEEKMKQEEKTVEEKIAEAKEEKAGEKMEDKTEGKKKVVEQKIVAKDYAVANARSVKISKKYSVAICKMIKGKKIDEAIKMLEEVIVMKRAVRMENREVGHKKGKGMSGGRYPINASKEFIRLLKQLSTNALVNGFDIEEGRIVCKVNQASRRYRRMGHRFKATHIDLRIEVPKVKKKKSKKVKKESNKEK